MLVFSIFYSCLFRAKSGEELEKCMDSQNIQE